jgi:hypothetical protein
LLAEVDDLSFEVGDLPVEGIDVGGLPSPGLVPDLLAEGFGQAWLRLAGPATCGNPEVDPRARAFLPDKPEANRR